MGLFDKPKAPEASSYSIKGNKIICDHCGNNIFFEKNDVLLNTRGLTFLGLDWTNKNSNILICSNCTKIVWFLDLPEKM